ncbi:hypothetical protein RchiOBHm_Chr7g0194881 [Rosa chinensis]|uniref:MORF/ORRM1/DAG-like MORF domain-containing protein n=1 Tax=Rosa chinensis TaxID=74649 RepID=A0A2P6P661_ROSCH|nr:hypothetical protein RchiOBHm_Chr7g0194881 [Rosa chinensis]
MCIFNASCDTHFGFCCDVNDETSQKLARKILSFLPMFSSIACCSLMSMPDPDFGYVKKDYSFSNVQNATLLFPLRNTKH